MKLLVNFLFNLLLKLIDHDIQIIGTRVTTDPDDCTIIIKNGYIEGMENHMAEIPKIVRRGKKSDASDIGTPEKSETQNDEKNDSPVVAAAFAGTETDAMRRAKEILARKRQKILEGNSSVEG